MGLDTKTYWLTDLQQQCDFDFDFNPVQGTEQTRKRVTEWIIGAVRIQRDILKL
jgi:hypothetical protein